MDNVRASTLHEQQTRRKQYLWQREMLERAVIALIHRVDGRELRSTFSRWQIRAVRSKRVLGAASGLVARLSFADRKAKVVASTMFSSALIGLRPLTTAWRRWYWRARFKRISNAPHMLHRVLSRAWRAWVHDHRAEARRRALRGASIGHMMHRSLSHAWLSWVFAWLEGQKRAARLSRIDYALRAMSHRSTALAWRTWHQALRESHEARRRLRRGGAAFAGRRTSRAFMTWLVHITSNLKLHRPIAHMSNRPLTRCWRSWVAFARTRVSAMRMLAQGVGYFRHARTRTGWVTWQAHCVAAARQLGLLHFGASGISHRVLSRGLRTWREAHATVWLMRRGAVAFKDAGLLRGWHVLLDAHAGAVADHLRLRRALAFLVLREQARAWAAWVESYSDSHTGFVKLRRAFAAFVVGRLYRGLAAWREEARLQRILTHGLSSMLHRESARAMNAWREHSRERSERLVQLRMCKSLNAAGTVAWLTGMRSVLDMARSNPMARAIGHALNRALSLSWMTGGNRRPTCAIAGADEACPYEVALTCLQRLASGVRHGGGEATHDEAWYNPPASPFRDAMLVSVGGTYRTVSFGDAGPSEVCRSTHASRDCSGIHNVACVARGACDHSEYHAPGTGPLEKPAACPRVEWMV